MNNKYPGEQPVAHEVSQVREVQQLAVLPFGRGLVGANRHVTGQTEVRYRESLARHQRRSPTGLWLPADCMDERGTIALATGEKNPAALAARKAASLPGGTALAVMKAAIAANAVFLRDAKTSKDAYLKVNKWLQELNIPDAAHEGCGASTFVQASTETRLELPVLVQTFAAVGADPRTVREPLSTIEKNVARRREAGFYDDWDPAWHAEFVRTNQPQNFSSLATDETPTHGHNASGLLLVEPGHYFAKNAFIEDTDGMQAFALTFGYADDIANLMAGPNTEESSLIKLAFRDDAFNVANHIVAPGLEVFAAAA